MGDYLGLCGWTQWNHKDPYVRESRGSVRGRWADATQLALKMEEGPGANEGKSLYKLEKTRK